MTPELQRFAIAQACGWVWYLIPEDRLNQGKRYRGLFLPAIHEYEGQSPQWLVRASGTERICNLDYMVKEGHLPDYLKDLNAMQSAWMTLDEQKQFEFGAELDQIIIREFPEADIYRQQALAICATARFRAEAFLKTIRKWQV